MRRTPTRQPLHAGELRPLGRRRRVRGGPRWPRHRPRGRVRPYLDRHAARALLHDQRRRAPEERHTPDLAA